MVAGGKSREEIRFLALLTNTNERAANIGVKKLKGDESDSLEFDDEDDWRLPKVSFLATCNYRRQILNWLNVLFS